MTVQTDPTLAAEPILPTWLPGDLVASLSPEQRNSLFQALQSPAWRNHPVNIRFTLPLFGKRFYLTLVGGEDRRADDRRQRDRRLYPLRTLGNMLFLLGVASAFYLASLVLILATGRLIEF